MTAGRFITIEGGEGAGKSTQARRLAERLRGLGPTPVLITREPGGAPGAEAVRALLLHESYAAWDPMSEALLHFAARREHLVHTVWPALERGEWVLSDRFADSSLAYQGYAQGLGAETIATLYRLSIGAFRPDLTLILDLPVEEGLARAAARGLVQDRYERMDGAFHRRLREAFRSIARSEPDRCHLIDATGDADHVADRIWRVVAACFDL